MDKVIESYFEGMFTSSNPSVFDEILDGVHRTLTAKEDVGLDGDFQAEEVYQELKKMAPLTALGLDGMSPIFYKSFWHIVGEDVNAVVLNALNSSIIPESINTTYISLIPKNQKLEKGG